MADDIRSATDSPAIIDEDQPQHLDPSLAPEIASPLAPFKGEAPPAPAWFHTALARAPERSLVPVLGANIELLTWGNRGKPGLILVHGNSAHADWWSFIAPFLADGFRVAALSLSGMGGSDWREQYTFETFASEIFECARAAGLYDAPVKPIYVGHSFGGAQVFYSAAHHAERMRACVLVVTGSGGPPTPEEIEAWEKEGARCGPKLPPRFRGPMGRGGGTNRVYPDPGRGPDPVPVHATPGSRKPVHRRLHRPPLLAARTDAGRIREGWTWPLRPRACGTKLDRGGMIAFDPSGVVTPLVHIQGDRSEIIRRHGPGSPRRGRPDPRTRSRRSSFPTASTTSWSISPWRWWPPCGRCWRCGQLERPPPLV